MKNVLKEAPLAAIILTYIIAKIIFHLVEINL